MILASTLVEKSQSRLPDDFEELLARAKAPHAVVANPPQYLKKRTVLLTEANVPASIVCERILGGNDYQEMNYFQRGISAGSSVCRIVITLSNGVGYGTGFLICDSLIMTNNHVLESADIARSALVEFDYELDEGNNFKQLTRAELVPGDFFYTNAELDFTIVAISRSQADRPKIRLIQETGKAVYNEALSIIQHPDGREKKIAVRNNLYIKSTDTTVWYSTDTSPGSSGSPVFNDDWQLVALHHSGVPETTPDGKFVLVDGTTVKSLDNIQESKIKWKANEGIRISSIVSDLQDRLSDAGLIAFKRYDELKDVCRGVTLKNATDTPVNITPLRAEATTMLSANGQAGFQKPAALDVSAIHNGHMQIIINIGGAQHMPGLPFVIPSHGQAIAETAKPKVKVVIDPDYRNRSGFAASFLHEELILPKMTGTVTHKTGIGLSQELKYHHFSIVMADSVWKMPYITAVNIDGARFVDFNRPSDAWFLDPRLSGKDFGQMDNQLYKNNKLDRGHMIRREDPSWGSPEEALKATFDTYHYTNACPQHMKLNQGKMEWQGLENYILDLAIEKKRKISVLTGPVLQDDSNEYEEYRGVRVPMQFYKVVIVNNEADDGVYAAAYVQSQYKHRTDFEAAYQPIVHQRSIKDLMDLTALDLSNLLAVDTLEAVIDEVKTRGASFKGLTNPHSFRIRTLTDIALGLNEVVV